MLLILAKAGMRYHCACPGLIAHDFPSRSFRVLIGVSSRQRIVAATWPSCPTAWTAAPLDRATIAVVKSAKPTSARPAAIARTVSADPDPGWIVKIGRAHVRTPVTVP